ncbi:hypothetical protein CK203_065874 [Vitis vinifera]|uniref:Endonuclease/exonuclease/phosphatase domain-containing protein n=1 Tax=Vitis vinifera TaxID=29760 RepID=A0A438G239_VITVI|nr:hypothetical protein CK203_065874 [Vitis vinifera]
MSERARERVSVREGESDGRERGERRVPKGLEGETRVDAEGDDFVGSGAGPRREVLEWSRNGLMLGPNSIGCFIEGLEACIENAGTGTWERKWKDSGSQEWLGVNGGDATPSGVLCRRRELTKKGHDVTEVINGENLCGSSGAVKGKRDRSGEGGAMQRELSRNMENWFTACRESPKNWGFLVRGSPLSLEKWRPERRCLQEGEKRSEAWVRILGLLVSLWERDILRRIGDACGDFLDIDSQTKMLEDLQWARILVKLNKERPPNVVEVRTEEFCYELTLWWEIRPAVRMARERKGKSILVSEGEVGGEVSARAGGRVRGWPSAEEQSLEENSKTDDALMEETLRYGNASNFFGSLVCVSPSLPSSFSGRTPPGEYYDRSGVVLDASQREFMDRRMIGRMPAVMKTVDCWEILEDNNGVMGSSGKDLYLAGETVPEIRDWREASWEESELARFSQFLGFSTVGLEKEILDFMGEEAERHCARKRGPVSSCFMKLRLVSWNVQGANDSSKRKVIKAMIRSQRADLVCIQETKIQTMNEGWKEREELWEELGAIRGIWEEPWCLGGDFNVTLSQRDRSRQGSLNGAMRRFAQVVDDLALIDLPLQGGVYSWSGGRSNQTWARLDRFLGGGMSRNPLRSGLKMWLKVDGFKELLREWWREGERVGRASFRMAAKMKEMKEKIKVWNRDVFGRVEVNKSSALRQIEFWDRVESGRDLSERETDLKNEAKENFKKWVLLDEAHWRQVSRELWLREGDKNTGFFHKMASAHWRNNFLDRIKINGVELVEEQEVRERIVKAFQHQLREEPGWRADLEGLHLKSLDLSEAEAWRSPLLKKKYSLL